MTSIWKPGHDMWERAYHLNSRNRRPESIAAFYKVMIGSKWPGISPLRG
ncbi:MAG: Fe-Mn family superoxide dismutase [Variovorax sp.]